MTMENIYTEKLFSYGTLQYEAVQLSTFGRQLAGTPDALVGYCLSTVEITDPHVIATSGESVHKLLIHTGNNEDAVNGMMFLLTPEEIQQADQYEVADYKRVRVQLRSGTSAWVYASADLK